MNPESLRALLFELRDGRVSIDEAMAQLRALPFESVADATVDHHRALRCGFAEVILCEGKTPEQVLVVAERIAARGQTVLGTRAAEGHAALLRAHFPETRYEPVGRTLVVPRDPPPPLPGTVLMISAGTSDLPVLREAATTARVFGCEVEELADVGVAGLHRLLAATDSIHAASVLVVVAGMEGALPTVVGGMTDRPVIAVPTSIGYGASFGGIAALLGMLTSCASGVTVVNIDNGFSAAVTAAMINRKIEAK